MRVRFKPGEIVDPDLRIQVGLVAYHRTSRADVHAHLLADDPARWMDGYPSKTNRAIIG
jgi:hypothetical protein